MQQVVLDLGRSHFDLSFDVLHFQINCTSAALCLPSCTGCLLERGGGLGSRPKKMYGGRLGDGVEYHSMKPTPRR